MHKKPTNKTTTVEEVDEMMRLASLMKDLLSQDKNVERDKKIKAASDRSAALLKEIRGRDADTERLVSGLRDEIRMNTASLSIRQMLSNDKRDEMTELAGEMQDLLKQEKNAERDKKMHAMAAKTQALVKEAEDLQGPMAWRGSRRDGIAYIRQAERQRINALQKDRKLRDMVAAYRQQPSEEDIQLHMPHPHVADAMRAKISRAAVDIFRFAEQSVAAGGRVVDAPIAITEPVDMIMQYYMDLASTRFCVMTSASAQDLFEMDAGAGRLDDSLKEYLETMRRDCNLYELDTEAGAAEGVTDSVFKRDTSLRRVAAMPGRVRGFQHSLECVGGTEARETEFRKRAEESKNALRLREMQSSLDAIDRKIQQKDRKKLDLDREIERQRQLEAQGNGAKSRAAGR